jgi:replicative DNA helicase
VPPDVLDPKTQIILNDFGRYFREFKDVDRACTEEFVTWFNTFAHPKFNEEQRGYYRELLTQVRVDVTETVEAGLMDRLVAARAASKLTDLLTKYMDGEEIDLLPAVRAEVEQFELDTNRKVKTPWIDADIDDLLLDDQNDKGFHFRLEVLNTVMRPLRPGDFGIIAARPDVGKTTLLASEVTHFAAQIPGLYPKKDPAERTRPIAWFNNEGPGDRIVKRLYQAALNATNTDLIERSKKKTVKDDYAKAIGGARENIRIFDVHDFWNHEVEDIIRSINPCGIVFDMVDNIKFGGAANNNGQRTDQLLEAMYQWARVIGVKHDCWVIACSQVSADGENLCYPLLGMLKDSKTGKQGAADFILTVGYRDQFPSSRYLGLTKNKLRREGGPKKLNGEVVFDGDRARYVETDNLNGAGDAVT